VELGLADAISSESLRARVNEQMPAGMQVVSAEETEKGSMQIDLRNSMWEVCPFSGSGVEQAIERLLCATSCLVTRSGAKGAKQLDVRTSIISMSAKSGVLRVTLRHNEPLVRPSDVVSALVSLGCSLDGEPLYTRLEQF
jgi:hypothetical protein